MESKRYVVVNAHGVIINKNKFHTIDEARTARTTEETKQVLQKEDYYIEQRVYDKAGTLIHVSEVS